MKKRLIVGLILASVLVLAACGGDGEPGPKSEGASKETIKLRAATGLSAQHAWWDGAMVPWMEKVEELTDGQVEFESFTGGELVSVPDEGDAILNGTIDVSIVLPIYEPAQYPMAEITMLPLSHSDTVIASNAWRKLLESDVELIDGQSYHELQFSEFKTFPISATQEYSISTTKKEFNSVDDLKGTSLRTPSHIHEVYAEKTGLNSVTIPAVEMYDAMSRGTFDGSFYSIADWSAYGFQDLFKYTVTGINFGHFNSFIGMSQAKWEELPENVQEAMEEANEDIFLSSAEEWIKRGDEAVKENEDKGGKFVEYSTLDQGVQDHLTKGIEETWVDYAAYLEEQDLPGNKLVLLWRDLIIEEGGEVPQGVMDLK